MTLVQTLLLFGCIVLGVFFLMDAAFYYLGGSTDTGQKRIKRRLEGKTKTAESVQRSIKRREQEDNSDEFFLNRYLKTQLLLADSTMTLRNIYVFVIAMTCAMAGLVYMFIPIVHLFASFIVSLIVSFILIVFVLKRQIISRNYRFEEQFPDAIELIVRSLRVGQPFSKAILSVSEEMSGPIAKEFRQSAQEIAYGRDLPDALGDMVRRISVPDLRFFVVAVQIQYESGGNLAEILENLAKIVRGRFRLMRKVQALTAEGRFSAWFLSLFPVLMIVVMNSINPGYYTKVSDHPYFGHLIMVTITLLIINVIAMRIMTKLEV